MGAWGSDAYGDAARVPALLEQLWSPEAGSREAAIDDLWSRLCHQETVYSASAAAVPALAEAARGSVLTGPQRFLILNLIVYIGRGEDTCWEGYSTREEVEACRGAVAAQVPGLVRWAWQEDADMRAAALALGVYHPAEFARAGVGAADLARGLRPAQAAGAELAQAIIAGRDIDAATVRAAAEHHPDTLEYLDTALAGEPADRQARQVALELLERIGDDPRP
jgi:hypothetical protein